MNEHLVTGVRTTLVLLLLTCGIYPLAVWSVGRLAFPDSANGSLLMRGGRVVGSDLIAQRFTSARYFHSRPSAVDYDAQSSGGSNLGPTSRKLRDRIAADVRAFGNVRPPIDAVTTSASGLDPHISPEFALLQVDRVARARAVAPALVRRLVEEHIEEPFLGIYGARRVNVLRVNLALDDIMSPHGTRQ